MQPGQKIKFKETITKGETFILEGIISKETEDEYFINCKRYPWKWNQEIIVRKPKDDKNWLAEI
jgi:hypothetical protein